MMRAKDVKRFSDFLLWECAYAELFFTDRMWPDFDETAFALALQEFHARKRRFGAVPPMVVPAAASGAAPDDHFQLRSSTPFSIRRNYTQQQSTRRPRLDSLFTSMTQPDHLRRIRFWLAIFITGLVLSGITAFPLQSELGWLVSILNSAALQPMAKSIHLLPWIERVNEGVRVTNTQFPFLAYGTDWLAFAHLVIAIAFVGPYIDPVRNKWVITFGLIGCAGVIPLALIAGHFRGIPLPWRLIDCSFGILGSVPLLICRRSIVAFEHRND